MYLSKDIVKEGNKLLREKCSQVRLPLSEEDLSCAKQLYEYLVVSSIEELVKKYKIRPGVGIAAPQVGVTKRMFAMNAEDFLDEKGTRYSYLVINPQIVATSKQMVYLPGGEGCLSVDRPTTDLVTPRYYAIKAKCAILDMNTFKTKFVTLNLEGYPAIVFQHEYDHLDGIMYVDKMYKVSELDEAVIPLYTFDEPEETQEESQETSE